MKNSLFLFIDQVFSYQVVVKFDENFNLTDNKLNLKKGLKISLASHDDSIGGAFFVTFDLSEKNSAPSKQNKYLSLNVFKRKPAFISFNILTPYYTISAKNTLLKLIHFDVGQQIYNKMPLRFTYAHLNGALKDTLKGKVKIFVNFMSHFDYDERRAHSGQVKIKWNLESQMQANSLLQSKPGATTTTLKPKKKSLSHKTKNYLGIFGAILTYNNKKTSMRHTNSVSS